MFLDTTILVEVLIGSEKVVERVREAAEREALFFSIVQVGEVADWCLAGSLDPGKAVKELKGMATVTGITEEICLEASRIKREQRDAGKTKFSIMDGLIMASAMHYEQELLTADSDFEGLHSVTIL